MKALILDGSRKGDDYRDPILSVATAELERADCKVRTPFAGHEDRPLYGMLSMLDRDPWAVYDSRRWQGSAPRDLGK